MPIQWSWSPCRKPRKLLIKVSPQVLWRSQESDDSRTVRQSVRPAAACGVGQPEPMRWAMSMVTGWARGMCPGQKLFSSMIPHDFFRHAYCYFTSLLLLLHLLPFPFPKESPFPVFSITSFVSWAPLFSLLPPSSPSTSTVLSDQESLFSHFSCQVTCTLPLPASLKSPPFIMVPSTKTLLSLGAHNYRQPRKAGNGRRGLLQGS